MNDNIVSYVLSLFDAAPTPLLVFLIFGVAIFLLVNVMALIGGLGTYAERKISADIQMRQGANRVGPYGILQFLADGVKMITKEDIIPSESNKFLFTIAPILCLSGVLATLAVVPISSGFILTDLKCWCFLSSRSFLSRWSGNFPRWLCI